MFILGVSIHQMSDRDTARLGAFLIKRAAEQAEQPYLAME